MADKPQRLQQVIDSVLTTLREGTSKFWQAFLEGFAANEGSTAETIAEFLHESDSDLEWSEAEIMRWIRTQPRDMQRELRKAASDAQSRGQNPHEFLCQARTTTDRSDQARRANSMANILDGWQQFQAEWLLTSAFIKDTFGGGLLK